MSFLVYKITNLVNGKIYIGAHEGTPEDGYMGSGKLVRRAVNKYGQEAFRKDLVAECDSRDEMYAHERELVDEAFVARKDTYNVALGGKAPSFAGRKHTSETRAKQSNAAKRHVKTQEHCINISRAKAGKPGHKHTEETKRKIGENSPGFAGHRHSPEARQRIAAAAKRMWESRRCL